MEIRALQHADAKAIAAWRYPDRYSTYDVGEIAAASRGFWAVADAGGLFGYCCFGTEARVPGIEAQQGTLDVGYGLRPDLVGRGLGPAFVTAILDFAVGELSAQRLRLLILSWNERSCTVAEALGFEVERVAHSHEGEFLVMTRAGSSPTAPVPSRPCPSSG